MLENPDPFVLHQALADDLERRGCIRTTAVEDAFRAVPRHLFVPGASLEDIYRDKAIPTKRAADGRFVSSSSQPAVMALMLEQLALGPGHRVLEVGAGTGYNAALMAHIVGPSGHVVTMDIDGDLATAAQEHLAAAGFGRVHVVCGDGGLGYPDAAPYDRIVLTAGASDIAPAWREQLKPGGRLLLALSIKGPQLGVAFEHADDCLQSVSIEDYGFMPLRGAFAAAAGRVQVGEISITLTDPALVNVGDLALWLDAPGPDRPTGVRVTRGRELASLIHWLALREAGYCTVTADGQAADRGIIPDLYQYSCAASSAGAVRLVSTSGMLGAGSLCLLSPPRGTESVAEGGPERLPFELFLRTFGPDGGLGGRVTDQIKAWETAGRPSIEGLRNEAYPKEAGYRPAAGELVVDTQWCRLAVRHVGTDSL